MTKPLPVELITNIIEFAYHLPDDRTDVQTLSACSLVCRLWASVARPLLFRRFLVGNIRFQGRMWNHPFDRATALLRSPVNLAASVRSIHLTLIASGASFMKFLTILSYCPHVYQLDLDTSMVDVFAEAQLNQLAAVPVKIRALGLSCSWSSSMLYQLLALWPSIQFLRLDTEVSARPPTDRPPFKLYELTTQAIRLPVFRWLLPRLQEGQHDTSLRILGFWGSFSDEVHDAVVEYAPHVRSLRLSYYPTHEFMNHFTALEELVLRTSPQYLPPVMPLPRSIQHLCLRACSIVLAKPSALLLRRVIDAVDPLPHLRLLTVNTPIAQRSDFGDLARMCAEKAVEVAIDASIMYIPEYPVCVDRFPRLHTMLNLYRMNPTQGLGHRRTLAQV